METGWQTAVDLERLSAWMSARDLETGPIFAATPLAGGTQNLLLRFRRGERDFVLRRPSLHPRPGSDRSIAREAKILAALGGSNVPHPRLIAACDEADDTMGCAFFLMEAVDGFNPTVTMPLLHRNHAPVRTEMGLELVRALAELHVVDPLSNGLEGFGRTEAFLERQAGRWLSQYESYGRDFPEWKGHADLPHVSRIAEMLEAHRPEHFKPAILHGDFHLANVLYRMDSGKLAAVIDWEMATIGPALLDLAWLLSTWPDDADPENAAPMVKPWDGFPPASDLVSQYRDLTGADLSDLPWYRILACYKFAIVIEGTQARASAGLATAEMGTLLHQRAIQLMRRADLLIREYF